MEKLLVLVMSYRSKEKPYENVFVHSRVKAYIASGLEVTVFVLNNKEKEKQYVIDEVNVLVGNEELLVQTINENKIGNVCAHFLSPEMIDVFKRINSVLRIVIVVHGNEALFWYQRLFPGLLSSPRLVLGTIHGAFQNVYSIGVIRRFLQSNHHEIEFVTVSEWMRVAAEKTWKCEGRYTWHIIPNIIDIKKFPYIKKDAAQRYSLLSIRPFSTGKYANDITAQLICKLSDRFTSGELKMTWAGTGRLYDKTVKPVKGIKNVTFVNRMLQQEEIPGYHANSGIFICPTRQDAQGVSMCEAMSSGLVPVTLYNTAIPEFLPRDQRLVCHDIDDMKLLVERLVNNPKEFLELSELCSQFIHEKCSYLNTVQKEIELFR